MNFLELASLRQSERSYDPDRPVEREKLDRCVEALRVAPSACNDQPWKVVVVDDPELKDRVAAAAAAKWLGFNYFPKQAPVIAVLVLEDTTLSAKVGAILKNKPYPIMDIGIAAEHFCLQAADDGLGTCIIGWFDEATIKELLGIPKKKRAMLIITVGYPKSDEKRKKYRKKVEEICSFNHY
jgi:nitroreductase